VHLSALKELKIVVESVKRRIVLRFEFIRNTTVCVMVRFKWSLQFSELSVK
jgi:hypothetical protein